MACQFRLSSVIPSSVVCPYFGTHKFNNVTLSIVPIHVPLKFSIKCSNKDGNTMGQVFRTCKNCKTQFDPSLNNPRACRYHSAHFGGETRRKFESVYSGGTLNTPESGKVLQYWHCCGSEDPFDSGCTAAPHVTYDD